VAVNKAKLASELIGVGLGGGSLEKLTIAYSWLGESELIEALFNPTELHYSQAVRYQQKEVASSIDAGVRYAQQRLRGIDPRQLSVDLLFDTYENRSDAASWKRAAVALATPHNPFQAGDSTPVSEKTGQVEVLASPDPETHQPPVCTLSWGAYDVFEGVLTNLDQRFTMFLSDGTPVRATLSCTFVEHVGSHYRRGAVEMHSADVTKTHTVRRHDTLQSIAAEQYGDPALWRPIAQANDIVNPRLVPPGTVLLIPKLRP
jgi:nucleoid-associated protein YgaU